MKKWAMTAIVYLLLVMADIRFTINSLRKRMLILKNMVETILNNPNADIVIVKRQKIENSVPALISALCRS